MSDRLASVEVQSTGWCPFNCTYCYIPKTEEMKGVHDKIVEDLKSGKFIERIKTLYGDKVEYLSLWGTEPLLTTAIVSESIPKLAATFPKLKEIMFSTAMPYPERLVDFIKVVVQNNLKPKIQISLDGPAFLTDANRYDGASKIAPDNMLEVVSKIQDVKSPVSFQWKSTLGISGIREMLDDPTKIDDTLNYFHNLYDRFLTLNKNKLIKLDTRDYLPTLVVPGRYSVDDGRAFANFLRLLRWKGGISAYTMRFNRIYSLWHQLGSRRDILTCSGGDSNMGMGQNIHICHRTFYYDEPAYVKGVIDSGIDNWDVSHFTSGAVDSVVKSYIVNPNDKNEITRFDYTMRGYHDFWRMRIGYGVSMLKELALANQVSPIYKDDSFAELFIIFLDLCVGCPAENLLNTGSINVIPLSIFRMWGNGAFEELVEGFRDSRSK